MGNRITLLLVLVLAASCILITSPANAQPRGWIVVPDNYPTITSAIAFAKKGDVIFVRKGTYVENQIKISKPVSLIGENQENTTIRLAATYTTIEVFDFRMVKDVYYGFNITAKDVVVSGFKIIPISHISSGLTSNPTCISATGNNTQILGNIIEDSNGIFLGGSNQTLAKNSITGTPIRSGGSFSSISTNNIADSDISVTGFQTMILNNTIASTSIAVSGSLNTIYGNKISGSLTLWENNGTTIEKNDITLGGITLARSSSITIANNSINEGGITLDGSSGNVIDNNDIFKGGISLSHFDGASSVNIVKRNSIVNGSGLHLSEGVNNRFFANRVENSSSGFALSHFYEESYRNAVYHNNFVRNVQQFSLGAVKSTVSSEKGEDMLFYFDQGKEGNYWSDYNGTDLDNDGIGDSPNVLLAIQEYDIDPVIDLAIIDHYPLMFPFDIENNVVVLPEPFPILPVAAFSVAVVMVVVAGLLVYFKKRKR